MIFYHLLTFSKLNFLRVSNCLDPDQDRHSVGPDLGPNCLQRLTADEKKLPLARKRLFGMRWVVSYFHAYGGQDEKTCLKSLQPSKSQTSLLIYRD